MVSGAALTIASVTTSLRATLLTATLLAATLVTLTRCLTRLQLISLILVLHRGSPFWILTTQEKDRCSLEFVKLGDLRFRQ